MATGAKDRDQRTHSRAMYSVTGGMELALGCGREQQPPCTLADCKRLGCMPHRPRRGYLGNSCCKFGPGYECRRAHCLVLVHAEYRTRGCAEDRRRHRVSWRCSEKRRVQGACTAARPRPAVRAPPALYPHSPGNASHSGSHHLIAISSFASCDYKMWQPCRPGLVRPFFPSPVFPSSRLLLELAFLPASV
ncbi:hypothetical protein OH77DRAFT_708490 [Trametes cingulata]|nr:hypothetical protein OH77DRAFT_708490 [Trametes cingulata]